MKKVILSYYKIVVCLLSFILLSGCNSEQKTPSYETVSITEVRKQLEEDMRGLENGDYGNLSCEDFTPSFPKSDQWFLLHMTSKDGASSEKGEQLSKRMKRNYDTARKIIGDKANEDYFYFIFNEFDEHIPYNENIFKQVQKGKYENKRYNGIMYDAPSEEKGCKYLWLDWNEEEIQYRSDVLNDCYPGFSKWESDKGEVQEIGYYNNTCGERDKDKTYILCDGNEVSIGEAIKIAEDWMQDKVLGDIPLKVKRVYVRQVGEKNYEYVVGFVTCWNDIMFDINGQQSQETMKEQEKRMISYDLACLYIMGKNQRGDYMNYTQNKNIEEVGEGITKCIPLKYALEIVSNNIGVASSYKVKSIGIAYRTVVEKADAIENNEYSAYPVWEIETENEMDHKETRFYVNAVDGTIEVDVFE